MYHSPNYETELRKAPNDDTGANKRIRKLVLGRPHSLGRMASRLLRCSCFGNQSAPAMSSLDPIWETKLPFEIEPGDGALIAKAMRAYRPDSSEEDGIVQFFIEQFEKLDKKQ